jgi:hypothetical protein
VDWDREAMEPRMTGQNSTREAMGRTLSP